jgi:hypothetical protein
MTLCPVALAVGCKKCPVFNVCPAKTTLGDYHPESQSSDSKAGESRSSKKGK